MMNPWRYVPTLYLAEGLPYTVVNKVSITLLKGLGAGNELISLTSFLQLPWALKLLWAPLVERFGTKRRWILLMQLCLAALFCLLALGLVTPDPLPLTLIVFVVIACTSATHDIAVDGYYLEALNLKEQALFVGIRSAAYRVAFLAGSGGLVFLAGFLNQTGFRLAGGFSISCLVCASVGALLVWYHRANLPHTSRNILDNALPRSFSGEFVEAFRSYLRQDRIVWILAFVVLFRLGDALLLKMTQPFLLDPPEAGGLGLTTATIGLIDGTFGTVCLLLGGIIGGVLVARHGLRRWMWPLALVQNLSLLLYWLLALQRPGIIAVTVVNAVEQLGYGLGGSVYTVFLMRTVKQEFKAAHYAIATSFMALGMMLPGAVSGYLQAALGYADFFLLSFIVALPGLLLLFIVPYRETIPTTS
jgi:PAT family beta-lactamase induction signal transducer AmpG